MMRMITGKNIYKPATKDTPRAEKTKHEKMGSMFAKFIRCKPKAPYKKYPERGRSVERKVSTGVVKQKLGHS